MEGRDAMHKGTTATRSNERAHHAFGKRVAAGLSLLAVTAVTLGLVVYTPRAQAATGLHPCVVVVGKHSKPVPLCFKGVTGATGHVGKTGATEPTGRSARQEPPGLKVKRGPRAKCGRQGEAGAGTGSDRGNRCRRQSCELRSNRGKRCKAATVERPGVTGRNRRNRCNWCHRCDRSAGCDGCGGAPGRRAAGRPGLPGRPGHRVQPARGRTE